MSRCNSDRVSFADILLVGKLFHSPQAVEIVDHGQNLIVRELITQRWHFSPQTQLAIGNPVIELLIRVMPGVFGGIQRRRVQIICITFPICAVTLRTDPDIDFPT